MRFRTCLGGLGAALLLTGAAGCLEEDGGYGNPGLGSSMISDIRLTEAAELHVEYADLEALREFAPALTAVGSPHLSARAKTVAELTGIDLGRAGGARSIGRPPNDAAALYGVFEPGGVKAKLAAQGYREKDSWVMTGSLPAATGITGWMNAVQVTGDKISYARSTAALEQLTGHDGPYLTDSAPHRAVVDCLGGRPAAAILHRLDTGVVGLAVDRGAGTGAKETLCFQGAGVAARLEGAVQTGASKNGRPWREILAEPKVERLSGDMARLTAKTSTPGVLFRAFAQNDLPGDLTSR